MSSGASVRCSRSYSQSAVGLIEMKPNAMVQFHFFHLLSVQGIFLLGIVDLMDEISLVDTSYDILRVIGAVVHCSKYVQNVMRTMEAVLKEL